MSVRKVGVADEKRFIQYGDGSAIGDTVRAENGVRVRREAVCEPRRGREGISVRQAGFGRYFIYAAAVERGLFKQGRENVEAADVVRNGDGGSERILRKGNDSENVCNGAFGNGEEHRSERERGKFFVYGVFKRRYDSDGCGSGGVRVRAEVRERNDEKGGGKN